MRSKRSELITLILNLLFAFGRQNPAESGVPIQETQGQLFRLRAAHRNVLFPIRVRAVRAGPQIVGVLLQSGKKKMSLLVSVDDPGADPGRGLTSHRGSGNGFAIRV